MPPVPNIRRALISVWDKSGVVEFARALHEEFGIELISTGGTARTLCDAGIPVTLIEDITGFPEMLDGRVKTLHPTIHAGILADRDNAEHLRQLEAAGIKPIDMVVVNLYPFEETVADPNCTFEQAIEMIDIGGVALLRAAAKNHEHVIVVSAERLYPSVVESLQTGHVSERSARAVLASIAFEIVSKYDEAIESYLTQHWGKCRGIDHAHALSPFSHALKLDAEIAQIARYGENPGQAGAVFRIRPRAEDRTPPLRGTTIVAPTSDSAELSYNNYLDADAALGLCAELTRAAAALGAVSATPRFASASDPAGDAHVAERGGKAELCPPHAAGDADNAERCPPAPSKPGSAKLRFAPVTDEVHSQRNLPHWQIAAATYWITYRSRIGELTPDERDIALNALRYWDGRRLDLHAAVVMPDHVHVILTPRELPDRPGEFENLSELLKSIKGFSGREISRRRGGIGFVWQHESFDRWIRDAADFKEKWLYIAENVVKEGLAERADAYRWWYAIDFLGWGVGMPVSATTPIPPVLGASTAVSDRENSAARQVQANGLESKAELCSPQSFEQGGARPRLESSADQRAHAGPHGADESKAERCFPGLRPAEPGNVLACVFVKHNNPCGAAVAVAADGSREARLMAAVNAYQKAYLADPNAAMGGVLACNFEIDAEFAAAVMETYDRFGRPLKAAAAPNAPGGFFVEVWIAPSFTEAAVAIIRGNPERLDVAATPAHGEPAGDCSERRIPDPQRVAALRSLPCVRAPKKWGRNVRLLAVGDLSRPLDPNELQYRSIAGGMLVQTPDVLGLNEDTWRVVTVRAPTAVEMVDLRLAWLICKHTKSNAISIVRDGMLIGNGAGQMSRVMSCRVAVWLARENGHLRTPEAVLPGAGRSATGAEGAGRVHGHQTPESARPVAASDAFFPFADGPKLLIDAGVTALIQPGGSKRDDETIALCNERGVAMIFTGTRHFRH